MQSVFADMTAEEALAHHKKALLALRVQHIAMVLVLGAMALFAVEKGAPVLYLFGLAGIIATFLLFFYRLTQAVSQFQDILWQDADVAKYRAALEAYYGQTKNRSTRNMLELELAFCDYFDGLDDAALERLARLTFKGRKSTQRLRSLNLQVLLYNAQNDTVRRDEALDRIRTMAARYRAYLESQGMAQKDTAPSFNLDLLGAANEEASFLGIPYTKQLKLTTFDQAREIVEDLQAKGIDRVSVRYLGWTNSGLDNEKIPNKAVSSGKYLEIRLFQSQTAHDAVRTFRMDDLTQVRSIDGFRLLRKNEPVSHTQIHGKTGLLYKEPDYGKVQIKQTLRPPVKQSEKVILVILEKSRCPIGGRYRPLMSGDPVLSVVDFYISYRDLMRSVLMHYRK